MKPGDIGLVSIKGTTGDLIRLGQWLNGDGFSRFEHAFVVVEGGYVVEAEPGGARHVRNRYDPAAVCLLPCPEDKRDRVASGAMTLIGTPYSFADYFALAAVRLHLPGNSLLRRYVTNTRHMICSQLADEAARRGGWELFEDGRLPQDVTPGDLWELATLQRSPS